MSRRDTLPEVRTAGRTVVLDFDGDPNEARALSSDYARKLAGALLQAADDADAAPARAFPRPVSMYVVTALYRGTEPVFIGLLHGARQTLLSCHREPVTFTRAEAESVATRARDDEQMSRVDVVALEDVFA